MSGVFRGTVYRSRACPENGSVPMVSETVCMVLNRVSAPYLDLVHVADSVIELHWSALLHVGLLRACAAVWSSKCTSWRRSKRVARVRAIWSCRGVLWCASTVLQRIGSSRVVETTKEQTRASSHRIAELCFRTFDADLRLRLLPIGRPVVEERSSGTALCMLTVRLRRSSCDGLHGRAHGRCHSDCVWIVPSSALYPIAGWQECVEALNQIWVAREQLGDAVDDSRGVDTMREAQS